MVLLLGLLLFSFVLTSLAIVPYINLLYRLKFQRLKQKTTDALGKRTPIFDQLHFKKAGTPIGGGLLLIVIVSLIFAFLMPLLGLAGVNVTSNHPIDAEIAIIFFTFISFGLLGLYDDVMKFFRVDRHKFFGLKMRHKLLIQCLLAVFIAALINQWLRIDILNLPFIGVISLGWLYLPLAALFIVGFTNAVNITDGLDGLASGILMIVLFALWFLSSSIIDTPLSIFISVWLGALIAFLYFNVYPARFMLGDVGSLAFGATVAVMGLLLGKVLALSFIGGLFIAELVSSFIQLSSKRFLGQKVFPVAPLHLWLQLKGWEEPKIVFRAWLAAIILALFGLWLALI